MSRTDDARFQIDEQRPGHVLARFRLVEERVEGVVAVADRFIARHLTVRLDAVLQTVQLPAS